MPSTIFSKPLNKQVAQNTADIAALSTSMGNANGAIAIVATGNTAPKAIPAGQFVLWSGGLYTANSAIASGETLSSSNLTAVPDGGLNALNSNLTKLTGQTVITINDFNDYTVTGVYHAQAANSAQNAPNPSVPGRWYILVVFATSDTNVTQIATTAAYNINYIRTKSGNTWSSWEELVLNGKLITSSFTSINTNLGYIKNNYMVTVYVMNASPTTTETSIGLLPSAIAPKTELRFGGICSAYGADNMQIKIKANGDVTIQADTVRVSGYGACTYVI